MMTIEMMREAIETLGEDVIAHECPLSDGTSWFYVCVRDDDDDYNADAVIAFVNMMIREDAEIECPTAPIFHFNGFDVCLTYASFDD